MHYHESMVPLLPLVGQVQERSHPQRSERIHAGDESGRS